MAPNNTNKVNQLINENDCNKLSNGEVEKDFVISGISGRFAEADNMQELRDNLMNNYDMVTEDDRRWPPGLMGLPKRAGKVKDLTKFDATFFGIHAKQIERMDPQLRLMLEVTYEAIADAGVNPADLRGRNVGVFVGTSNSDYFEALDHLPDCGNAYSLTGCNRGMFANRVSFHFDLQGPSIAMDTACSSSLFALDQAMLYLRNNRCDAAIVGGLHLCLRPAITQGFYKLGMLSRDGTCKTFDASASGYVRSEAVVAIFLQKSVDARRIYATIVNSKSNSDGYKFNGITYPRGEIQNQLLSETYAEVGINPKDVAYVEAHGTGTAVGDPEEMNSIADFFCKDRNKPLLVGSIKSSYGHAEAASGLASVAKLIVAMQEGIIPANLHYSKPNSNIPGLFDNQLKVVTENTTWYGGLVGVSSFGFGGVNAHVILRSHPYPKIPRLLPSKEGIKLFVQAGRTEEQVDKILSVMENDAEDRELYALLSFLSNSSLKLLPYRGYTLLNSEQPIREVKSVPSERQPVWYVMTGMGCQWKGMAREMMQIKVFRESLLRANDILKPYNINLLNLLMSEDERTWDSIVHPFVALISIQVALVNTMRAMGIEPDGIVGHSVGELSCAYADGCFTEEQTILAAYWRGRLSVDDPTLPVGLMASIGISWEEAQARLPENIHLACNNAEDNVTISGLRSAVVPFIEQLQQEGVFCRAVKTGNLSYHCKFIAPVAPKLLAAVKKLVPNPKPRSSRWISSSIPESQWDSSLAATSSADYHVNNLLCPVLFQNALKKVPKNAIVIEIGAHCLLQAIVKRNLGTDITYIGLQKRNENGLTHFLTQIGKLYLNGLDPKVQNLFDPVPLPVPRGTRMISPLIGWNHTTTYDIYPFQTFMGVGGTQQTVEVSIENEESSDYYLIGHSVDGRVLFPATGYITLAWKTYARIKGHEFSQLPIVFENITFHRATILSKSAPTKLSIGIMIAGGYFEISEGGAVVATGRIYEPENGDLKYKDDVPPPGKDSEYLNLSSKDFYKELRLRGYDYGPTFQGVLEANNEGTAGKLKWNGNWVTFMDAMLQFSIIGKSTRLLHLPTGLEYLKINPFEQPVVYEDDEVIPVLSNSIINVTIAGGVEMKGIKASVTSRRPVQQAAPILERYSFIPFQEQKLLNVREDSVLKTCLDIVHENSNTSKFKIVEVGAATGQLFPQVINTLNSQLLTQVDCIVTDANSEEINAEHVEKHHVRVTKWDSQQESAPSNISDAHLVFGSNFLNKNDLSGHLTNVAGAVRDDGFLLLLERSANSATFRKAFTASGLELIAEKVDNDQTIMFLLKKIKKGKTVSDVIVIREEEYNTWVEPVKAKLIALSQSENTDEALWLVGYDKPTNGILGLVNCLRYEPGGDRIRSIFDPTLDNSKIKQFSSDPVKALHSIYPEIVTKNLVMNVNRNGVWGSYRHLPLDNEADSSAVELPHAHVDILTKGDLSTLRWVEFNLDKNAKDVCRTYYASLNFKDIMLSSGKLAVDADPNSSSGKIMIGLEFSGRDKNGRRIMGVVPNQGLATAVAYDPNFVFDVPDHWTLEDAATAPLVYLTVYYALVVRGKIRKGESILIQSGSGGVGQAAINVALSYDCEIYTTVGTKEKKETLLKIFPQLKASNIFNSRDLTFENDLMIATNGKGVDLILNSLAEEKLLASIRCLGINGRFLEIGKFDLANNNPLGMSVFLKNATFHGVLADLLMTQSNHPERDSCINLLREGLKSGVVKPLTRHLFGKDDIETAFRFMASGKHIGKVVIKIADEEPQKIVKSPSLVSIKAIRKAICTPGKSYIIAGGLGGFGLEVAHWLVEKGAENLVLSSRSGVRDGYQSRCVRVWRKQGVNVVVSTSDVTTPEGATKLLTEANKLGPVGGIFNLAMVLRDAFMENQTVESYETVGHPKVRGTRNLDAVSRKLCPQLEWFVVFSSLSCGRGNAGQSNYGYANSTMERICEERRKDGLPGLAIQWGGIGDVGVVMENMGGNDVVIGGTIPQTIRSCVTALEKFLTQTNAIVSSFVFAEKETAQSDGDKKANLLDIVGRILGVKDMSTVNPNSTLAELGMDSIMGVEIKQTIERNFDLVLSTTAIRKLDMKALQLINSGNHLNEGKQASESVANPKVDALKKAVEDNKQVKRYNFDDMIPSECVIRMNKVIHGTPIFIVHPIEGGVNSLYHLANKLNCPVYGIQVTANAPLDSFDKLSAYYVQQMKAQEPEGPYRLAGYSFGAAMAFDIATKLQATNNVVEFLAFLDGSHRFITSFLDDNYIKKLEANELKGQDEVDGLVMFSVQFANFDFEAVRRNLISLTSWESRVQAIADLLMTTGFFKKAEDIKFAATVYYKLSVMGLLYKPNKKFNGDVVLVKATTAGLVQKWGDDYGLSDVVTGSVKINTVSGDHFSFLHLENAAAVAKIFNESF